jgi:hypothetical protein
MQFRHFRILGICPGTQAVTQKQIGRSNMFGSDVSGLGFSKIDPPEANLKSSIFNLKFSIV